MHEAECLGSDFCQEFAGDADTTFRRVYDGCPTSRVVSRDESFFLLADMSPLTVGHLLFLPRVHYFSFASMMEQVSSDEVRDILPLVVDGYRRIFGSCALLEHGSSRDMNSAACVTHAHWHIVPLSMETLTGVMSDDGLVADEAETLRDVASGPWSRTSYYLCSDGSRFELYRPHAGRRSQYLRSVVGRVLGMRDPEWDFALITRRNLLRRTIERTMNWDPLTAN